jgi:hypothetical protein
LLLAAGCGSVHRVVISPDGEIGPLRMDRSTRADVVSFAGKPDVERLGGEGAGFAGFTALGYGCEAKEQGDRFPMVETSRGREGPDCETIFWVNRRTSGLADFYTSSSEYEEHQGVRIGMKTAEAERLLHRRADVGCEENIYLGKRDAPLTVAFDGGHSHKLRSSSELHLVGGHVYAFALPAGHSDIGIFDCL